MMKILSVSNEPKIDNTKFKFSDEFNNADWLYKADVLMDCIIVLQEQYIALMGIQKWDDREKHSFNKPVKMYQKG